MATFLPIVGSTIKFTARFTSNGAPVDPSTVTGKVRAPDGTQSDLSVTNDSVGVYSAEFQPTMAGAHTCQFKGTGDYQQLAEIQQAVQPSTF